ncbi:MAG: SpoIID/LytB domain-containing protein, partial [Syntrophomonadaceae bacterium]|nr:SpoIID/LytB domain-containing protein [Syntrophomonadaceae bacterium]
MVKPSLKLRKYMMQYMNRRLMNSIIKRRNGRKKRQLSLKAKVALIMGIVCFLLLVLPTLVTQNWNPVNQNLSHTQKTSGTTVAVLNHQTNTVMNLPLETYLVGVVAAEMPASFEQEALKVQAIVARTYALKRLDMYTASPNPEHPEADVCTDSRHCQAWKSEAELRRQWGLIKFPMYYKKIIAAVESTKNKIITYEDKLIDPVYHSTCGGRTENSEDVWAKAIPYLRSVPCKWDQTAPRYEEQLTLT